MGPLDDPDGLACRPTRIATLDMDLAAERHEIPADSDGRNEGDDTGG